MILPGNGGCEMNSSNWYGWLRDQIVSKYPSCHMICENMPDSFEAKEKNWMPFILEKLKPSLEDPKKKVYVIGHSSGAVALMRLIEHTKITGAIIAAGCISHLGDNLELISGYYPVQPDSQELRPWQWEKMKENTKWIMKFGSEDDCFIPIDEIREIKDKLSLKEGESYIEFSMKEGKSHFMFKKFPELLERFCKKVEEDFQ
mmetsp:Transcript_36477/g.37869  ORF Transcript_36477/g.37869 Transcript_36477/m.37869 type:complete len:202 (+) Transcript_36477:61-666(+)